VTKVVTLDLREQDALAMSKIELKHVHIRLEASLLASARVALASVRAPVESFPRVTEVPAYISII